MEKATLEEKISQVEKITEELGGQEKTLEESFDLYQQGIQLIKEMNLEIEQVEKKMQMINEQGELEDF